MKNTKLIFTALAAAAMAFAVQAHDHGHVHEHHHDHQHGGHQQVEFTGHEKQLSEVEFSRCWVRLVPGGRPSAAYFDLKNTGNESIALIGVRAENFIDMMLHETTVVDGISKMGMVDKVVLEAGESVSFEPKANHVMLTAASEEAVTVGDTVTLQFKFEGERVASTECLVKAINSLSFES